MLIFKYYQKVKINLVKIILGISLSIALTNCKVDANFEVKDFIFCRAVLINNKVPLVKISWNALDPWEFTSSSLLGQMSNKIKAPQTHLQ